jgi:GNAT superfamily N-acetyltransferase
MLPAELEISSDPSRIDVEFVCGFLATSYWAQGRSREVVERSVRHSLCYGVYHASRQVAFGRAITDLAVFAYFADIFVVHEYRRRGIGKALIAAMLEHPDLRSLPVVMLRTRDAHGLYAQFGFEPVPRPDELMGRYLGS